MKLIKGIIAAAAGTVVIPPLLLFAPQVAQSIAITASVAGAGLIGVKEYQRRNYKPDPHQVMWQNGENQIFDNVVVNYYMIQQDAIEMERQRDLREWIRLNIEPELQDWYMLQHGLVPPPKREKPAEEEAIDVQSQTVYTAKPMQSAVQWSDPNESQPFVGFPVEDVALTVAESFCDRNNANTVLLACPSGTGKSSFINAAIVRLSHITEGRAQFAVFNGKHEYNEDGSLKSFFCGLERDPNLYMDSGSSDNSELFLHRLTDIVKQAAKHRNFPLIAVCDEINNSLIAANILDSQNKLLPPKSRPQPINPQIEIQESLLVTKGRSGLVLGLLTAHYPFVDAVGLNTGEQDSVRFVCLARADKLDAIHSALNGQRAIIKNPQVRDKLAAEFQAWEMHPQRDMDATVALTNIRGGWRLVTLPRYDQEPRQIIHTPTQPAARPQAREPQPKAEEPQREGRFTQVYLDFIKSPEWKQKRQERLKIDGYECCTCKAKNTPANPLQVDHKHYPPRSATFADFVNQPLSELRTLCRQCHEKETKRSRNQKT